MKPSSVDAVIPYVDASDPRWRNDFTSRTGIYSISPVRFRSWGTLKYLFRSIDKYMPFVGRIVLIVARESQVPIWVNKETVKIIYHRDFIPREYLPTFNSCTIESFLYNITDLSEQFIYFNDDIFPNNPLSIDDFFSEGIPHIRFNRRNSYNKSSIYRLQCRRGLDMIADSLKVNRYPKDELIVPEHGLSAMLKPTLDKVGESCKNQINLSISILRQPTNVNRYIYSYYDYYMNNYIDDSYKYAYMDLTDDLSGIRNALLSSDNQIICLNDSDNVKNYNRTRSELIQIFEEKLPRRCKYE